MTAASPARTQWSIILFLPFVLTTSNGFFPPFPSYSHASYIDAAISDAGMPTTNAFDNFKPTQEWDSGRYKKQHSFVWKYGYSLIDLVNLQPGERLLDVGCGTGELTYELAESCSADIKAHCMGMDSDASMIHTAREQYPGIEFFQGDGRNFELREPVDVVFSNAALHWIKHGAENAVLCMARCLKPGGRLVVEFGGRGNVDGIVTACLDVLGLPASANIWYFPSIAEYCTLLERHGIEVTAATLFDRPTVLQDGEAGLRNWLRMFANKFFEHLGEKETEQVLEEIEEKLRPTMFDGSQWTADYRRIRVVGRKLIDKQE